MFIIFSPSKGMNSKNKVICEDKPSFIFPDKYKEILNQLKTFKKDEIANIMKIKNQILDTVYDSLHKNTENQYLPAIQAYNGLAYRRLDIKSYDNNMNNYLGEHLLILSALYGIHKSHDLISYHRLDMGIKVFQDKTLYAFWKEGINRYIEENSKDNTIVNLASNEFSKLIDRKKYNIIDIQFKENSNGKIKSISTNSKKMRGTMLDFMVKNQIKNHVLLKEFDIEGYKFSTENSKENTYVFIKE